jgi:outer membrane protein assembly factor BamB
MNQELLRGVRMFRKKRMFPLLWLILIIPLFLHTEGKEDNDWHLEEVLSIGSLEDDTLFQWVGVAVDHDQNIYVTDTLDYSLKKFDAKGKLAKKTGRKGQGPGEFLAPRYIDNTEISIYVSDQYTPKIQVFDKNLNYTHSIPIPMPVSDFSVLPEEEIAVATLSTIKSGRIYIFNSTGKIQREIQYTKEKLSLMMDMVNFEFDSQGNLFLVYNYQDKIEKFSPEGKKLWSKKLLGVKKVQKEKIASLVVPSKLIYKDIALDHSGNIFVLGGSFSKNPSRDVYILNPEGDLLNTITLPDTSHCIYIDSKDYLYSRANEGVTLKKYKIKH